MEFRKTDRYGRSYNACLYRRNCSHSFLCTSRTTAKKKHCSLCEKCNSNCPDFKEETCARLEKHLYNPSYADQEYRDLLSESRSGISYSEEEIRRLDSIVSPLILKEQSLNHICANNIDTLMVSESTLYRLVEYNVFQARNIDLPRKIRYSRRRKLKNFKIDKACKMGCTYNDYIACFKQHPDLPVTQMHSVEEKREGRFCLPYTS